MNLAFFPNGFDPWSFCTGAIGSGISIYATHRFSSYRDKTKRFNEASDIFNAALMKERLNPSPVCKIDFDPFRRELNRRKLASFDVCVTGYNRAREQNMSRDDYGGCFFQDVAPVICEIDKLLKFTGRR